MRELTDIHFPEAEQIRVVLDNLSTHSPAALYSAFPPAEARRVLRRLEFHYTPKHASWLNMVEIEIGVLRSQCLDQRIATRKRPVCEIAAWERQRNHSAARIKWMFTIDKARSKMARAYPETPPGMASQIKESKSLCRATRRSAAGNAQLSWRSRRAAAAPRAPPCSLPPPRSPGRVGPGPAGRP